MRAAPLATPRSAFLGSGPRVVAAAARPLAAGRRPAVQPAAFFGFGAKKEAAGAGAAPAYYICIDCGWIYDQGEFKSAPGSFRCPVCNSPKSRFKAFKGAVKGRPNNSGGEMKKRFQAKQW